MSEFGFTKLQFGLTVEGLRVAFGSDLSPSALEICDLGKVISTWKKKNSVLWTVEKLIKILL